MRTRLGLFALFAALLSPLLVAFAAPPAHAGSAASDLATRVRLALRGSSARHLDYRIAIQGVGVISHDATRMSAPASNEKLFTTITLLQMVGPEFHYATTVSGTSPVGPDGTLHGDLVLRGSGDPTLTTHDLKALARRLHAIGLRHVTGRLVVDDSRYSHVTRASGWKHKFVPEETGTVDAFSVDANEWRGGAAFERDPTYDNARLWRNALRKAHVSVAGRTTVARAPAGTHPLATHRSADLASIVDETLTNSVNFYAEMMLREAGAQRSGHGSLTTGIAAVHALARRLGLPLGTVHDGSGLSYTDRESPAIIERWLALLPSLPSYNTVYFALPLGCDTGTLVGRLCGPHVRGKVRAKTGTLNHVSALSGYVTARSGHRVTFSFLASGFKDKNLRRVLDRVDAAVATLARTG
jgi:serine-type D-Ala-D-Ala carboxypeptidase/endopeptidase (penicillin-binding protein 4)